MSEFVHLHAHSTYSFLDGLAPVGDLVAKAKAVGQRGIALTDHGNLFGAPQFFQACAEHDMKGVIGMEAYEAVPFAWDTEEHGHLFKQYDEPRYHHLTLWAMDLAGWKNLCQLHSISYTKRFKPRNQPLIDRATLEQHSEGLMVGLGCIASKTNKQLMNNDPDQAYEVAKWYKEVFGDRAYMEVMANTADQQALLRGQRKVAEKIGIPVIATNDVHYVDQADGAENGCHHTLVQARRWKSKNVEKSKDKSDSGFGSWYGSDGFFVKSRSEMLQTGGLLEEEIDRTAEVLDRVSFDPASLPEPQPPQAVVPEPGDDPLFDIWLQNAA